jgi:hypothetical protein
MSTATLLQQIFMLSFNDKVFIAEQIMHSIRTENADIIISDDGLNRNQKQILIAEPKTYSIDEAFQMVEDKLNRHYGTNLKIA